MGEVARPSLLALVVLLFLMLITQALRLSGLVMGSALDLSRVIELVGLLMPSFLVLAVPISLLFGVMAALARMSRDNELMAMSLLGRSRKALLLPMTLLGTLGFVLAFIFAAELGPVSMDILKDEALTLAKENLAGTLRPGGFAKMADGLTVYAASRAGNMLHKIFAIDRRHNKGRELLVLADQGVISALPGSLSLELGLKNGELYSIEEKEKEDSIASFKECTFRFDVGREVERRTRFIQDAGTMTLGELLDVLGGSGKLAVQDRQKLLLAAHRKLALPGACLIFVLLGIVVGPRVRTRARAGPAIVAALIVALYYVFFRFSDHVVARGLVPAWIAAWMPNLVLLAFAVLIGWIRGLVRP